MITITLNENILAIEQNLSLKQILENMHYNDQSVAVAINRTFIPRNQHAAKIIQPGDNIEIVAPMQGG